MSLKANCETSLRNNTSLSHRSLRVVPTLELEQTSTSHSGGPLTPVGKHESEDPTESDLSLLKRLRCEE